MWSYEFATDTDVDAAACWKALEAVHMGRASTPSGDRFEPHGPFAVGSEVSITPAGQDTFRSVVTELQEGVVYADETRFDGLTLTFRYTFTALPDGGTRLCHRLVIDGPAADEVGPQLGPQIAADFPTDLAELISLARG
jgi:hypothetical protein